MGLAAEGGVVEAMHHLGIMYEYGLIQNSDDTSPPLSASPGSPRQYKQNNAQALKMYREAFSLHHADSGYNLALMIAYGRGAAQDGSLAMEIFRKCALEFNHAPSMRYLGIFSVHGHGMANGVADYKAAVTWFDKCERTEDPTVSGLCGREKAEIVSKINLAEKEIKEKVKLHKMENIDIDITPY